jgi:hypothetical protein
MRCSTRSAKASCSPSVGRSGALAGASPAHPMTVTRSTGTGGPAQADGASSSSTAQIGTPTSTSACCQDTSVQNCRPSPRRVIRVIRACGRRCDVSRAGTAAKLVGIAVVTACGSNERTPQPGMRVTIPWKAFGSMPCGAVGLHPSTTVRRVSAGTPARSSSPIDRPSSSRFTAPTPSPRAITMSGPAHRLS